MSRLARIALALVLALAFAVPAFGADLQSTDTVDQAVYRGTATTAPLTAENPRFHAASERLIGCGGTILVHNSNGCFVGELGAAVGRGGTFNEPKTAFKLLSEKYGISEAELSSRFHILKPKGGLGAADSTRIDLTGNVYDVQTGDRLGQLIIRQGG